MILYIFNSFFSLSLSLSLVPVAKGKEGRLSKRNALVVLPCRLKPTAESRSRHRRHSPQFCIQNLDFVLEQDLELWRSSSLGLSQNSKRQ
jgi:hypothetical protein